MTHLRKLFAHQTTQSPASLLTIQKAQSFLGGGPITIVHIGFAPAERGMTNLALNK
jgi:hypothetical protein